MIGFATYTNLATQTNNTTLTADIWNEMINKVNTIGTQVDSISSIGVNQTRQAMDLTNTSSPNYRTSGGTYTNTTGKPIVIHVSGGFVSNGRSYIIAYINGVEFARYENTGGGFGEDVRPVSTIIIPNNTSYKLLVSNGINKWFELR